MLLERLSPPDPGEGPVAAVLDTDTYNEVDDQFALAYALLSPERINLEAVYAAPFHNARSDGPGDGMERSYEEILRFLRMLETPHEGFVFRGSASYLPAPDEPVRSDAADDLVRRAMTERDGPLYVVAIGAVTNVASAILLEPRIVERIVVVWLGGQPYDWPTAREFNLKQDIAAARVVFDSGAAVVHVPCINAAEHLRVTVPELESQLGDAGALGRDLTELVRQIIAERDALSKVLWDIAPVAWLIEPTWVETVLTSSPILTDELTWSRDDRRHLVRVARHVSRDRIMRDVYEKLRARAGG